MYSEDDEALGGLGGQLFDASLRGEAAEVARLLDLNASVEHREGENQFTPLMAAAHRGHIDEKSRHRGA